MEPACICCDVLVIGGGGAGCQAAIHASDAGASVALIEKGVVGYSGCTILGTYSCCAALGYADARDNPSVHMVDTIRGGAYVNDQELVHVYTQEAPLRVLDLVQQGARFEMENGRLKQTLMPGHSYPRACYADMRTGQEMQRTLRRQVRLRSNIRVVKECFITELVTRDGEVVGAHGILLADSSPVYFDAKAVIIATGGCGQVFQNTTTSVDNTGDGIALAYRAGAEVMDMEFVQFYPTSTLYPKLPGFSATAPTFLRLMAEPRVYNGNGDDFLTTAHPDWRFAMTRDRLAQLIYKEVAEGRGSPYGGVYLDVSHYPQEEIEKRLSIGDFYRKLRGMGIDLAKQALQVTVSAHYFMGGIRITPRCETSVPGLYAAGEAVAGVHGANRLGGNALSEILVTGTRAGVEASRYAVSRRCPPCEGNDRKASVSQDLVERLFSHGDDEISPTAFKAELKSTMWQYVAVSRTASGLRKALNKLHTLERQLNEIRVQSPSRIHNRGLLDALEVNLMVDVCRLITKAALVREESRGAHYREDFPGEDNQKWLVNLVGRLDAGQDSIVPVPVNFDHVSPGEGRDLYGERDEHC